MDKFLLPKIIIIIQRSWGAATADHWITDGAQKDDSVLLLWPWNQVWSTKLRRI